MLLTEYAKKNIVCALIAVTAALLFILPMYFFTTWSLSDIMLLPGALYLAYVGLRWVARFGTFDVFAYQMTNWFNTTFRRGTPKKYEDAYAYKEVKATKREDNKFVWIPWVVVGALCLILCLVFAFFPTLGR